MNIIFDLGGVVIAWDPDDFAAHVFTDPETRKIARKHILDHADWIEMDRGTLTKNEAIVRGVHRSGLSETEVHRLMHAVPSYLTPFKESLNLIQDLKNRGNHLYVLSNLHPESIAYLENEYTFLDLFEGKVISCRINTVKPEREIYEYIVNLYNLDCKNTVFIDDMEINLEAAAKFGMKTIHFKNIEQCKMELIELGCFK